MWRLCLVHFMSLRAEKLLPEDFNHDSSFHVLGDAAGMMTAKKNRTGMMMMMVMIVVILLW